MNYRQKIKLGIKIPNQVFFEEELIVACLPTAGTY